MSIWFVAICKSTLKFSIYVICSIKIWKLSYQSGFLLTVTLSMRWRNRHDFTIIEFGPKYQWIRKRNPNVISKHSVLRTYVYCLLIRNILRTLWKWIFCLQSGPNNLIYTSVTTFDFISFHLTKTCINSKFNVWKIHLWIQSVFKLSKLNNVSSLDTDSGSRIPSLFHISFIHLFKMVKSINKLFYL